MLIVLGYRVKRVFLTVHVRRFLNGTPIAPSHRTWSVMNTWYAIIIGSGDYYVKSMEIMMTKEDIKETLRENRDILTRYNVHRIGVFGSHARGRARRATSISWLNSARLSTFSSSSISRTR